jgi:hypothetical protein
VTTRASIPTIVGTLLVGMGFYVLVEVSVANDWSMPPMTWPFFAWPAAIAFGLVLWWIRPSKWRRRHIFLLSVVSIILIPAADRLSGQSDWPLSGWVWLAAAIVVAIGGLVLDRIVFETRMGQGSSGTQ